MSKAALGAILCSLAIGAATLSGAHDSDKTIAHVLNRVAFGARPGDLERLRAIGVARYIDDQLHPERLADPAMDARLAEFATLRMTSREIAEQFEIPQLKARLAKQRAAADTPGDSAGNRLRTQPNPEEQRRANQVVMELSEQKLLRAASSERQLQEVLVDFWFNHFNVDARKGATRFLLTEYERDTIRPHVLGKFRDLLEATAKSPAMLFYLDNWQNGRNGLNENYGRELMELHTLGVDGGYTQQDVTEVARALTGWTIDKPRQGGGYHFDPRLHDAGEKTILGHVIKAGGGESDGEQVLDILARHPSTARFIATALVRRFVSDTPPPALVDRVAARFRQSGGDLREVTRAILTSREFLSPDAYGAKMKTPFEFVVSAVRTTGARVENTRPLVRAMRELGMPLYFCQPPTGYKDSADAWVNTGALVSRMNFALALADGQLPGIAVASEETQISNLVIDLADSTRATIARANTAPQRLALTLGSPEFQRR
jgi:uncharacterized protein (DUF1800 family)